MGQCQCREAVSPRANNRRRAHKIVAKKQLNIDTSTDKNNVVHIKEESNRAKQPKFDIPQVLVVNGRVTTRAVPETPDTIMSPESLGVDPMISPPIIDVRESLKRSRTKKTPQMNANDHGDSFRTPPIIKESPKRSNKKTFDRTIQNDNAFHDVNDSVFDYDMIPVFAPTSLLDLEQLDAVIPEEVDPDAPSDEEEDYEANLAKNRNIAMSEPGRLIPGSDPRTSPQTNTMRSMSDPNSAIHHPPLVTPPPGQANHLSKTRQSSLDSQTMAEYRKLKLQIKLAAHTHKKSKKRDKLEDRVFDVKKARELWGRFEEIESVVKETKQSSPGVSPRRRRRRRKQRRIFDLHNPDTWFFDFEHLMEEEEEELRKAGQYSENDDDDDNISLGSQGSLSLLSVSSMESQKRYYAEKQRLRELKDGVSQNKPSLQATLDAMEIMLNNKPSVVAADDASNVSEASSTRSVGQRMRKLFRAPSSIKFSRNAKSTLNERTEIPVTEDLSDDEDDDEPKTPPKYSIPTDSYKVPDAPNASDHKRSLSSRIQGDVDPEFGDDNDYRVSRRRRQYYDPAAESPEQPSAELIDIPLVHREKTLELPPIEQTSSSDSIPRWRKFSPSSKGIKDSVITSNAAKCLENVYAAMEKEESSPNRSNKETSHALRNKSTPESTPTKLPKVIPESPKISTITDMSPKASPKALADHSKTVEHLSTPKKSKSLCPPDVPPAFSIYSMSTEQFLSMASRPKDDTSLDGSATPAKSQGEISAEEHVDDASEKSFSDVVLDGVTNLLSQFQNETPMDDLSDISNVEEEPIHLSQSSSDPILLVQDS